MSTFYFSNKDKYFQIHDLQPNSRDIRPFLNQNLRSTSSVGYLYVNLSPLSRHKKFDSILSRPGDSSRIDRKIDSYRTKSNTVIIMAEQIL